MMQLSLVFDTIRSIFAPLTNIVLEYVPADWIASLPVLTLIAFAIIALVVGSRFNPVGLSIVGVVLAGVEMILFDSDTYAQSFGGLFVRGPFADFFMVIILMVTFLVLLSSTTFFGDRGPFHFLLLTSVAGALWVTMATDLVGLFLAWELMSTPTYVLAALGPSRAAVDGAIKYFVMGLLASMMMLLGIALVYGVTGETDLVALHSVVNDYWSGVIVDPQRTATLL
ncbi:MAG: proton-conducting transporter transmembrane domain-containing protein, partial [Candidatus Thorarchaeota archaeon]